MGGQQATQPTGYPQQGYGGAAQSPRRDRGPGTRPILKPARVNEIITKDAVTVEPDTPIRTAVAKMAERDVGSVVVVEEEQPVGVLTDRTVALALEEMPDVAQRPVGELIEGDVVTADPSMSILDVLDLMSDHGIRRIPIVDDDGGLRGIVTLDDALVHLGSALGQIAETVEMQSPSM